MRSILPALGLLAACQLAAPSAPCTVSGRPCAALEQRAYYDLEEGLTCTSNTPPRTVLKTWRGKITFERDGMLLWGPLCNDNPEVVKPLPADLVVAADLSELRYGRRRYVYRREPPHLCPAGTWCPADAPAPGASSSAKPLR